MSGLRSTKPYRTKCEWHILKPRHVKKKRQLKKRRLRTIGKSDSRHFIEKVQFAHSPSQRRRWQMCFGRNMRSELVM